MLIQEVTIQAATKTAAAMAHIFIDGTEYMVITSKHSATVLCGQWCHRRWARGKTFFDAESMQKHYKRHGRELVEYAHRLSAWAEGVAP